MTITVTPDSGYKVTAVKVGATALVAGDGGNYSWTVSGDAAIVVETEDASVVYNKVAEYTFTETIESSTSLEAEGKLQEYFAAHDSTAEGLSDIVTAASGVAKVYSGDTNAIKASVFGMKTGTGSVNGTFTLTVSKAVKKIAVTGMGWTASDTLAINTEDPQAFGVAYTETAKTLEFVLDTAATSLAFTTAKRSVIQSIAFFTAA